MEGAELERLLRDELVLRLRTEENLTYRQIAERVGGISYVTVGKILKAQISTSEANIQERREHLSNMLEIAMKKSYDKYLETGYASDLHAYIKSVESYKTLWGLNAPTNHEIHNFYNSKPLSSVLGSVLVDAPQPIVEAWINKEGAPDEPS